MINRLNNPWIYIFLLVLILYVLFYESNLNIMEGNIYELRSLQKHLKQIVEDNPTYSVYCTFYDKNRYREKQKIQFEMFDTIQRKGIIFYADEYNTKFSNIVKIDSIERIVSICNLLNECCDINNYEYVNYYKESLIDQGENKLSSKQYPTIKRELTPDEMFSVSSYIEIRGEVYKFISALEFTNTHKKDVDNIAEGDISDSLFIYYRRYGY